MRRLIIIALALLACKREKRAEPAATATPTVGSYQDLVESTQKGSATEARTELACTSQIRVPPKPEHATTAAASEQEFEKRQTKLAAMAGDTLVREATPDELVDIVMQRLMRSLDQPMKMSAAERDVWLAAMYDGEVNNGGHHQFFFNSSGDEAIEVRDALARIGRTDTLAIYDCALTAFPGSKPARDRAQRNEQLARWGEKQFQIFEHLDSAYYASTSWTSALDKYIRAHIADMPNARMPAR
jgi:hypothetical protein